MWWNICVTRKLGLSGLCNKWHLDALLAKWFCSNWASQFFKNNSNWQVFCLKHFKSKISYSRLQRKDIPYRFKNLNFNCKCQILDQFHGQKWTSLNRIIFSEKVSSNTIVLLGLITHETLSIMLIRSKSTYKRSSQSLAAYGIKWPA